MSEELAQKLGREDADRLLKDRKLVLLVDLDQTLVHTTNDNIPPNLKVNIMKTMLCFNITSHKYAYNAISMHHPY